MKIVHIITRLILGGAQENTLLSCEGAHRAGHEVTLITGPGLGPEGQLMDRARSSGYRVIELNELRRAINPFYDVPAYFKLKKLIAEMDPDIVHTHSAKAGILGRWAAAAVRKKAAVSCCSRVSKLREAQAAACGRPRIVHTIHGLSFHRFQSKWVNRIYIALERSATQSTDAFISVAHAMTEQCLAAGIGRREQFTRVFSGMESAYFVNSPGEDRIAEIRREFDIPSDAVVIATVARLFELKGHEYVIESAKEIIKRHKNVVWFFIGDGLLRGKLEREIADSGLKKHFRLAGLMPPERIGALLHASDILVHPSLREGLARTLPQALMCGRPVISFDVDGAKEVVVNNQTGLLIAPKDVKALTESQELLIQDPVLRQRLGDAGQQFCQKEFDANVMVDRIEKVYRSLLLTPGS
ncbi:MAG: glycosyltransferase family 4 protein [Phycisphaerae bacterium]|nr:glycosyltransferase family 4 protein [Phycisphaerae bacterium]